MEEAVNEAKGNEVVYAENEEYAKKEKELLASDEARL
jgi:hypothetical protein